LDTSATRTATPATGSSVTGWSGEGCSGTGPCTVSMTQARTVTATFTPQVFTLTVSKLGSGSGTVASTSPPGAINCGTTCSTTSEIGRATRRARPATGSRVA